MLGFNPLSTVPIMSIRVPTTYIDVVPSYLQLQSNTHRAYRTISRNGSAEIAVLSQIETDASPDVSLIFASANLNHVAPPQTLRNLHAYAHACEVSQQAQPVSVTRNMVAELTTATVDVHSNATTNTLSRAHSTTAAQLQQRTETTLQQNYTHDATAANVALRGAITLIETDAIVSTTATELTYSAVPAELTRNVAASLVSVELSTLCAATISPNVAIASPPASVDALGYISISFGTVLVGDPAELAKLAAPFQRLVSVSFAVPQTELQQLSNRVAALTSREVRLKATDIAYVSRPPTTKADIRFGAEAADVSQRGGVLRIGEVSADNLAPYTAHYHKLRLAAWAGR